MAVEVNIPQEFQVSCCSILLIFLSVFRHSLPLLLPLNARAGHAPHARKAHFARTTFGEERGWDWGARAAREATR